MNKEGLFIALQALLCLTSSAALAAGEFERGCEFYKAKNYGQARINFEKATSDYPKNWAAHYYLANTYLALGQLQIARKEYEACMGCNPDATTSKYCLDIILKLGGSPVTSAESKDTKAIKDAKDPAAKQTAVEKEGAKESAPEKAESPALAAERAHAKEMRAKAEQECAKIRAEAKAYIANGATNGNTWFIKADGLGQYVDFTRAQKDAILQEAEEKCIKIMEHVERSTAHIKD